ncbi:hypothetical protein BUALT_Bualt16G0097500 [Buddleja alternifolia]|uniref:Uncharacterized protein n=1 Tax=Buddleja alternifolia TaxID=168488 RepID=A0AAV6WC71_9LAMI|nr:hypothetical protein BUALT_Bualt16G0097500 [Buddleja alternifolia]
MGLNDVFKPVRGQILLMRPLPYLEDAYSMIQQEERQMDMNTYLRLDDNGTILLATNSASKSKFGLRIQHSWIKDIVISVINLATLKISASKYMVFLLTGNLRAKSARDHFPNLHLRSLMTPQLTPDRITQLQSLLNKPSTSCSSHSSHLAGPFAEDQSGTW